MKILVVVPARGGSKGLPGKNLLPVGGVSMTGRAVRVGLAALRASGGEGRVLVDTDDAAIAEEGRRHGGEAPFLRPAELAGDAVPMADNVLHALSRLGDAFDRVVLLQPTSPLRTADDVARGLALATDAAAAVAVVAHAHVVEQTLRLADDGTVAWAFPDLGPDRPRQAFPRGFRPSGSVYVLSPALLAEARTFLPMGRLLGFEVPRDRAVDVDTADDLAEARALHDLHPERYPCP